MGRDLKQYLGKAGEKNAIPSKEAKTIAGA